jgi:PAS domain S-box-containing protein
MVRERNREHAKRSRIRKRLLLGTLQDRLSALRVENVKLRRTVQEKLPTLAGVIFDKCTIEESDLLTNHSDLHGQFYSSPQTSGGYMMAGSMQLGDGPSSMNSLMQSSALTNIPPAPRQNRILMEPDFRLIHALQRSQNNFVLSDPSLPDNPIVYCSEGFCKLTGYKRQFVLGRNCRFLQGPGTDQHAVDIIRQGLAVGADISVCLLNYKADGTPFWNQFFLAALRDADGSIVNFVGVQCEVNSIPITALKDRVKRLKIPDSL